MAGQIKLKKRKRKKLNTPEEQTLGNVKSDPYK